jgi:hypothetical protein
MQQASKHILYFAQCIAVISIVYFLSLIMHLPMPLIVLTAVAAVAGLWFLQTGVVNDPANRKEQRWAIIILMLGCYFITKNALALAGKHGQYDAVAIWNLFARFLSQPDGWQGMFHASASHPDYPLCLPAFNAYWFRLLGHSSQVLIPFVLSFCITLFIPAIIYLEQAKKNLPVAALVLFFLSRDAFYIEKGVSQYADTLLAFFFLCAFICIDRAKENRRYIALSAAFLGACIWTKNEGTVLAVLFILFNIRSLFSAGGIKYFAAGIALPLMAWLVFKTGYAPANDMVRDQSSNTLSFLHTGSRYHIIWESFKNNLNNKFGYVETGFYLYLVLCLLQRQWPGRHMWLLLSCLCAYFMIYVITPRDLNWQLATSQDRLMHQLMPAMVYVIATKLSEIRFVLAKEETP